MSVNINTKKTHHKNINCYSAVKVARQHIL